MSDQQITCSECGDVFVFTDAEQNFYREKGLAAPPKRCKACRQARKAARGGGGGGGGGGGPRRFGGGPSEYRNPMGGDRQESRGPRSGPPRGARARDDRRPPRREGGGGWLGGDASGGGGRDEYRSPAFPDARPAWSSGDRPRGPGGGGGGRPPREHRDAQPKDARPPRAPRPERPKFDITCAECGAAAQVPFKPIEGRQVYCQECYRAKKGEAAKDGTTADAQTDENGIVE